ncbi:MAG: hypothetical protein HC904_13670 [Blastochloris sp.]|nr:hypothetical protein [Blastochloris sp.]
MEQAGIEQERLDRVLVQRGLVASREKAQRLIEAGCVRVDGCEQRKVNKSIRPEQKLEVLQQEPYVSRGGLKLEAALEHFQLCIKGLRCLDLGASTGGFTDCLLQRGAASVLAVDVGHGQLAPSLRADPRVESREGLNVRDWSEPELTGAF